MAIEESLVGRSFPPTPPHQVTEASVADFARAIGVDPAAGTPPTYPIVVTFTALEGFLAAEEFPLERVVHGDQGFTYTRPVVVGDELTATLAVTGVRTVRGMDIIKTTSEVTDASGALVCTATATIIHRGEAA